tara:strand:- start:234 stop:461 length:228 start_codon:yes stop_codon:yes gene_type:complete
MSALFIFVFLPVYTMQTQWVKTDNGCEYLTGRVNVNKIEWDGECLDGKAHGKGTIVLYERGELMYEFEGIIQNGD